MEEYYVVIKKLKKVFNGFILSILVSALLVTPSILGNNFHWFDAPSVEISVNAQTPAGVEEKQQRNSELSQNTREEKKIVRIKVLSLKEKKREN